MLHFGKSTLAAPSISFHFCIGKSTSVFNYQLYMQSVEPWDLLKIEMFLCQENQAV